MERPTGNLVGNIEATCRVNIAKSSDWKSKVAAMATIFKIYFELLLNQLTQNLVGRMRVGVGVIS